MKKQFRLCKNDDFVLLIKNKNFQTSRSFTLYAKDNDLKHIRVGISVGKKQGNAVVRNKIKRQIRMMISKNIDYALSKDYLIMIRKDYFNNNYQDNEQELNSLFEKINKRGVTKK